MNETVLEADKLFLSPYITYIDIDVFNKQYLSSYEYNDPSLKEFVLYPYELLKIGQYELTNNKSLIKKRRVK